MTLVWLDGALVERSEARVSIDDLGFLYGAACFETMRAYEGVAFRLDRHLERLAAGLAALGVRPPSRNALTEAVSATLAANGLREARIRLTVTAGSGAARPVVDPAARPAVLVVAEPAPVDLPPAVLAVAAVRIDEQRPLRGAKTVNYLPSLLALAEARTKGADEALLLNTAGAIAEAAASNVFAVYAGTLVTPPLHDGGLPGITRAAVIECARALDVPVEERSLTPHRLTEAGELFLTNSVAGVRPVALVAGRWHARQAPGPVTARLAEAYARLVGRECAAEASREPRHAGPAPADGL